MATKNRPHATDFVDTHLHEAIKTYSVYDGSNRLIEFYTAEADASDGDQCMVTYYSYDGASTRVEKSKEALSTWQSAWDI